MSATSHLMLETFLNLAPLQTQEETNNKQQTKNKQMELRTNVKTWLVLQPMEFVSKCFEIQTYIEGHHVYKDIWTPEIREQLKVRIEPNIVLLFAWKG